MVFIVTYDLVEPNDTPKNYESLIEGIKSVFSTWCHIEKSAWLVKSDMKASEVRETLKAYLHEGDILFVGGLSGKWASWNLGDRRNQWIKDRSGDY